MFGSLQTAFFASMRKVMGQKRHHLIPLDKRLHGTARTVMRQKTVCFLLSGHGSIREKWSNAAWKVYVAGPSNRYMTFVGSTSQPVASKREIYASEKRTELSQTTGWTVPQSIDRV
jgi:hypothetical protein